MADIIDRIELDDLGKGLYSIHLERKNHRICRVLRILMLRMDFIPFLKKLEDTALLQETHKRDGKEFKLWAINFLVAGKLTSDYLNKISRCKYIKKQDEEWGTNFYNIAHSTIVQTYLDGYANSRNKNTIWDNMIFFNDSVNYPNITDHVYDKEIFWKIFNDAFYRNKDFREKYGSPHNIVMGGTKFDDLPNKENIKPTRPKICQIIFDDTTEKQELIDYIDKKWVSIDDSLKAMRPSRKEKRLTSSGNFIRDVDIYNKYQSFKDAGYKNPDIKTYSWLQTDSEHKKYKEPNTIRKIVSLLKGEIEEINLEK